MAVLSSETRNECLSSGYCCLYSKKTREGNTVFTGSFTDIDTGRTYYLRSNLSIVKSTKKQGSDVCIVNLKTYKASKNRGR